MLLYLDTSVLLSLILAEARSDRLATRLSSQKTPLGVSLWTVAEAVAVLGVKVRTREMTAREGAAARIRLVEDLAPSLQNVAIERETFARCLGLLADPRLGLRAPDALHLAICRGETPCTLVTADRKLYNAARKVETVASFVP